MERIVWTCDRCGQRVHPGTGYLSVELAQVRGQGPVTWVCQHRACAPDPLGEDVYDVPVGDVSDWEGLARWQDHLLSKRWFARSDWHDTLRRVSGPSLTGVPSDR